MAFVRSAELAVTPFYDADQVRQLCVKFNPDVSFADFQALESTYNIPSLVSYRDSKAAE